MGQSTTKRWLLPGALVAGGVTVGSFLAPIGLASAQTDDTDDTTVETPDSTEADGAVERRGRGHHLGRGLLGGAKDTVAETLGLTGEELREALSEGASLADVAAEQGVAVEDLVDALTTSAQERIDEALAEGRIEAERADEISEGLAERIEEFVNSTPAERKADWGQRRGWAKAGVSEALQEALGLSPEEIREALSGGMTIGELAEQQGLSVEDLAAALVAEATERLDAAVEDGRIDADRAAEAAESLEERIENFIENGPPERGERRGRGGFGHHGPRGGEAPADGSTAGEVQGTSLGA